MVLTDQASKPFSVSYIGDDAVKAQEIFDRECADKSNLCVRMFIYPSPMRTRYPSEEAGQASGENSVTVTTAVPPIVEEKKQQSKKK